MSGAMEWGALIAVGDKSKEARHLDRSLHMECDVASAPLVGPDLTLYLASTTIGRILKNAKGNARAAAQFADVFLDVSAGATGHDAIPNTSPPHPHIQSWHPKEPFPTADKLKKPGFFYARFTVRPEEGDLWRRVSPCFFLFSIYLSSYSLLAFERAHLS